MSELLRRGIVIHSIIEQTGDGREIEWLASAIREAKRIGGILVAESMDRIMRPALFDIHWRPHERLTTEELIRLQLMLEGVPTFTLIHPNTPFPQVRSIQTKRGMRQEMTRKTRRELMREKTMEALAMGCSTRNTAEYLSALFNTKISHMTIQRWSKEFLLEMN